MAPPPDTAPEPRLPPHLATRFAARRVLGSGGFGTVFLATDRRHDRPVALKVLHGRLDDDDATRFTREAKVTARLRHPNVVEVLDAGTHPGGSWIAYAYLEGETLATRVGAGDPPATWGRWGSQLADALRCAHEAGVVHRDVKPENVLVVAGEAVLVDFGIARPTEQTRGLTPSGVILGTPAFLAPEVFRGDPPGPATDQWGLAATLFAVATGRPPYGASDPAGVLAALGPGLRLPPVDLAGVPRGPRGALGRALADDPGARFPDLGAFGAALRGGGVAPAGDGAAGDPAATLDATRALRGGRVGGPGTRTAPLASAPGARAAGAPRPATGGPEDDPRRRPWTAAWVVGFFAIAAMTFSLTPRPRPDGDGLPLPGAPGGAGRAGGRTGPSTAARGPPEPGEPGDSGGPPGGVSAGTPAAAPRSSAARIADFDAAKTRFYEAVYGGPVPLGGALDLRLVDDNHLLGRPIIPPMQVAMGAFRRAVDPPALDQKRLMEFARSLRNLTKRIGSIRTSDRRRYFTIEARKLFLERALSAEANRAVMKMRGPARGDHRLTRAMLTFSRDAKQIDDPEGLMSEAIATASTPSSDPDWWWCLRESRRWLDTLRRRQTPWKAHAGLVARLLAAAADRADPGQRALAALIGLDAVRDLVEREDAEAAGDLLVAAIAVFEETHATARATADYREAFLGAHKRAAEPPGPETGDAGRDARRRIHAALRASPLWAGILGD